MPMGSNRVTLLACCSLAGCLRHASTGSTRIWTPALAGGILLFALWIGVPCSAAAHALVLESSPRVNAVLTRAPSRILLRFNSRIEKALSSVTVTGPEGRVVPLAVAASDPSPNHLVVPLPVLPPGQYLVRWRVLTPDGHVTDRTFRFRVVSGVLTRSRDDAGRSQRRRPAWAGRTTGPPAAEAGEIAVPRPGAPDGRQRRPDGGFP